MTTLKIKQSNNRIGYELFDESGHTIVLGSCAANEAIIHYPQYDEKLKVQFQGCLEVWDNAHGVYVWADTVINESEGQIESCTKEGVTA